MKKLTCSTLAAVTLFSAPFSYADTFSDDQKKAIQSVVHDYLVNQPEVLIEASQALQSKQQQNMQSEVQGLIKKHAAAVFDGTQAVAGNPKGNVTLVEFFDYQCIHCKKMTSTVDAAIKANPNLRVVFKEFPIFGEGSAYAARAALAAAQQNKYFQMHAALLNVGKQLNQEEVMKIAKSLNLNIEKLKKDMDSQGVKDTLANNRKLAENLHLMGTPAFIIASTPDGKYQPNDKKPIVFIPGAITQEALTDLIKKTAG